MVGTEHRTHLNRHEFQKIPKTFKRNKHCNTCKQKFQTTDNKQQICETCKHKYAKTQEDT